MAKKQKTVQGTCRHCGQTTLIHLPEGWDEDDENIREKCDDMATEQCECAQAQRIAGDEKKKKAAIDRMTKYYLNLTAHITGQDPEAERDRQILGQRMDLMIRAIDAVTNGVVAEAGIRISASEAVSVGYKGNGDLRIKRVYKGAEEWIF